MLRQSTFPAVPVLLPGHSAQEPGQRTPGQLTEDTWLSSPLWVVPLPGHRCQQLHTQSVTRHTPGAPGAALPGLLIPQLAYWGRWWAHAHTHTHSDMCAHRHTHPHTPPPAQGASAKRSLRFPGPACRHVWNPSSPGPRPPPSPVPSSFSPETHPQVLSQGSKSYFLPSSLPAVLAWLPGEASSGMRVALRARTQTLASGWSPGLSPGLTYLRLPV